MGVVGWEKAEALLYLLKMIGYRGNLEMILAEARRERLPRP